MQEELNLNEEEIGVYSHPGGKLRELGAEELSDAELLAIIISTGTAERPAIKIAEEILAKFGSFVGMAGRRFEEFETIKGLGDVKIHRIAATLEIARRVLRAVE